MVLAQIDKTLNISFFCPNIYIYIYIFFGLGDNDKEVHSISDKYEFGDANEDEVNEPPNAT